MSQKLKITAHLKKRQVDCLDVDYCIILYHLSGDSRELSVYSKILLNNQKEK